MKHVLTAAIAVVALGALPMSPAADAEPPVREVSVEVGYADLNLSSAAGARTMLSQLNLATRKICGERPHPSQISAGVRHTACTRSVMSRAVETLGHPTVTAAYIGRMRGGETASR